VLWPDNIPIRECVATAAVFRTGLDALHDTFLAQRGTNPGKLPVVRLKCIMPVTTGRGDKQSTNYQPVFEIIGWVVRPDDLKFVPKGTAAL
jgi:hypothetical protein